MEISYGPGWAEYFADDGNEKWEELVAELETRLSKGKGKGNKGKEKKGKAGLR